MHMPHVRSAPDGLPELQAGAHLTPEDGACLMEYVAVVRATVLAAHAAAGDTAVLRRLVRGAERRYDRVTGAGPLAALARHLDMLHWQGVGRRRLELSLAALGELPQAQRHTALRAAMAAALAVALAPTRPPAVDVPGPVHTTRVVSRSRSSA